MSAGLILIGGLGSVLPGLRYLRRVDATPWGETCAVL